MVESSSAWPVFAIVLEARAPEANRWRRYDLRAGRDLLGDWIVETRFGRIGAQGRCLRRIVAGEDEARRLVRQALQRRRSAPRRIGAAYVVIETHDPAGWIGEDRHEAGCAVLEGGRRRQSS